MGLVGWSWLFLVLYIGAMVAFGFIGRNKIKNADDFATARSPW